jgi:hypothetical protein
MRKHIEIRFLNQDYISLFGKYFGIPSKSIQDKAFEAIAHSLINLQMSLHFPDFAAEFSVK